MNFDEKYIKVTMLEAISNLPLLCSKGRENTSFLYSLYECC